MNHMRSFFFFHLEITILCIFINGQLILDTALFLVLIQETLPVCRVVTSASNTKQQQPIALNLDNQKVLYFYCILCLVLIHETITVLNTI